MGKQRSSKEVLHKVLEDMIRSDDGEVLAEEIAENDKDLKVEQGVAPVDLKYARARLNKIKEDVPALLEVARTLGIAAKISHYRYVQVVHNTQKHWGAKERYELKLVEFKRDLESREPYPCGGRTRCDLVDDAGNVLARGVAKCLMTDTYNYSRGAGIALKRALKQYIRLALMAYAVDQVSAVLQDLCVEDREPVIEFVRLGFAMRSFGGGR